MSMLHAIRCPACQSDVLWQVVEVLERDLGLVRMGVWLDDEHRPVGSFELVVCGGCGLTEWWAHGVGRPYDRVPPRVSIGLRAPGCQHCGSVEAYEIPMLDQVTGDEPLPMAATTRRNRPSARLRTWVCRPCGLTDWRLDASEEPLEPEQLIRVDRCRRCSSTAALVVPALDATTVVPPSSWLAPSPAGEALYDTRFVAGGQAFWGPKWWGRFELRLCPDCHHVDWVGRWLDGLKEDPKYGIRRLRAASHSGPYR